MADWRRTEARVELVRLVMGGWTAHALFAAGELGVFALLEERARPAADVAAILGTDPDSTERLLGALVAAGVLERAGDLYSNAIGAHEFLVPGKPESLATWLGVMARWNGLFARLPESLRSGEPVETPAERLADKAGYTREFIIGMHEYGEGPAAELARGVDLSGRARLLDVGGGAGTYSLALCAANPSLSAVVFDLPEVVPIAEELIVRQGLDGRVAVRAGDYLRDEFTDSYDAALLSNVLHQEEWDDCVGVLRRVHDALVPGGLVVVHASFLDEGGDGPLWSALHNLVLMLGYRGGRAYSREETLQMLAAAGYEHAEAYAMSPFNAGSYVTAVKA